MVELFIKQGNTVRERQQVFIIPDTDVLQVITSIHEAMVDQVKPGMKCGISVDVFPDMQLLGEVKHVSTLPQPEDWRKSRVKFYQTQIALDEQTPKLRPGMSAKVEILIDTLEDVLAVPVQSVLQSKGLGYCYVMNGSRSELRKVQLGRTNDQYIEVKDGMRPNERVVLSPDVLGFPADIFQEPTSNQTTLADAQRSPKSDVTKKPRADGEADRPRSANSRRPKAQKVQYTTALTGQTAATGTVEFEIKRSGDRQELEFEASVTGAPPEAILDVAVDGIVVGRITVGSNGAAEVEWSQKNNNFPTNFPAAAGPGSTVSIGEILSGTLKLE